MKGGGEEEEEGGGGGEKRGDNVYEDTNSLLKEFYDEGDCDGRYQLSFSFSKNFQQTYMVLQS